MSSCGERQIGPRPTVYRRPCGAPASSVGGFIVTRSQIRFVGRIEFASEDGEVLPVGSTAQVYCHSDGGPSSVLPALAHLEAQYDEASNAPVPSFVASNFIFLSKLQGLGVHLNIQAGRGGLVNLEGAVAASKSRNGPELATLVQPGSQLEYGVEDPSAGIHGGEEYLYVVELPSRGYVVDSGEWTVKVSEHCGFPRWGGPTEAAFERATWQYEGPISTAIKALVAEPA